ncbi:DUF3618 domain-containing protein [Nonomuraea bangladeshensis]|uniref:DUF3618 domain-containing protein n=1 Tax=Nonomuraea bangladeshensis TaxID=404385 RepID=UPI0031DCA105
MSETDPGYSEQHAGDVGAHRATVGAPTEPESVNVPPTRPGATENARRAEAAREGHETFIPEGPIRDERAEAVESLRTEERSMREVHRAERAHGTRRRADDEDEDDGRAAVRRDIEETREQLGRTVSALADKADVKSRASHAAEVAKDRAAEAAGAFRARAAEAAGVARDRAGVAAAVARERAAETAGVAKERASEAAGTVRARASEAAVVIKDRTSEMAGQVGEHTPEQMKAVAVEARRRPALLVAVAAGAVAVLVVRRMARRRMTARRTFVERVVRGDAAGRVKARLTSGRVTRGGVIKGAVVKGRLTGRPARRRLMGLGSR